MLKTLHKKKTTRPGSWLHDPGPTNGTSSHVPDTVALRRSAVAVLRPGRRRNIFNLGGLNLLGMVVEAAGWMKRDIYGTTDLVHDFVRKNKENIPGFQGNKYGNQHLGWSKHRKKGSSALPETMMSTHTHTHTWYPHIFKKKNKKKTHPCLLDILVHKNTFNFAATPIIPGWAAQTPKNAKIGQRRTQRARSAILKGTWAAEIVWNFGGKISVNKTGRTELPLMNDLRRFISEFWDNESATHPMDHPRPTFTFARVKQEFSRWFLKGHPPARVPGKEKWTKKKPSQFPPLPSLRGPPYSERWSCLGPSGGEALTDTAQNPSGLNEGLCSHLTSTMRENSDMRVSFRSCRGAKSTGHWSVTIWFAYC